MIIGHVYCLKLHIAVYSVNEHFTRNRRHWLLLFYYFILGFKRLKNKLGQFVSVSSDASLGYIDILRIVLLHY